MEPAERWEVVLWVHHSSSYRPRPYGDDEDHGSLMAGAPPNNALHQTRRGGAAASRPIVEARPAGEAKCYPDAEPKSRIHRAKVVA